MPQTQREKMLRALVLVFKSNGNVPVWFNELYPVVSRECGRYVTAKSVVAVLNIGVLFEVVESLPGETKRWGRRYRLRPGIADSDIDVLLALVGW